LAVLKVELYTPDNNPSPQTKKSYSNVFFLSLCYIFSALGIPAELYGRISGGIWLLTRADRRFWQNFINGSPFHDGMLDSKR